MKQSRQRPLDPHFDHPVQGVDFPPPLTVKPGTPAFNPMQKFTDNMELVRRFYHDRPRDGIKLEYGDQCELIAGDIHRALQLAIEGKDWKPPQ